MAQLQTNPSLNSDVAVIIVDHGSRRRESNDMLHRAAEAFAAQATFRIVEPAHMELAEPTISQAFARCVERGAKQVVVFPYFLSPGRHWTEDIPALVTEAAAPFPSVKWLVTAPFGQHPGMLAIINDRIAHCRQVASSTDQNGCDVCGDAHRCQFRAQG